MEYRGTAYEFGAFLERTVGKVGYLIGTRGELCTPALIAKKRLENPDQAAKIDQCASKWLGLPVADCMGWCEMFENGGDVGKPVTTFKYPDRRTYGDYALAQQLKLPNGKIADIPKGLPYPIAVGYYGHVGFYHKEKVYQSAGHCSGTIITGLYQVIPGLKAWEYWYQLPYLSIGQEDIMLKRGDKDPTGVYGPVSAWQQSLLDQNIKMIGADGKEYGVDGSFGSATENGTNTFQSIVGLPKTGIVDNTTMGKMDEAQHKAWADSNQLANDLAKKNEELSKALFECRNIAFDRKKAIDDYNAAVGGLASVK